ncbi:MAG: hypothetical protein JWM96_1249, partial [Alphaproteobacteria bacterium]|nr:hypothetical protein [Alphaproteobacteria bacterium]
MMVVMRQKRVGAEIDQDVKCIAEQDLAAEFTPGEAVMVAMAMLSALIGAVMPFALAPHDGGSNQRRHGQGH